MTNRMTIAHSEVMRGRKKILEAGTLELPLGSVVALVGVNGAGKTSLIMLLAGLLTNSRGNAEVRADETLVEGVALVPQLPMLPDWLTVRQAARLYGLSSTSGGDSVSLADDILARNCGELSTGQRQTVSVRFALAQGAPLTLLDEPLSSIDIKQRPVLLEAIVAASKNNAEGVTIISSHIATDLWTVCDYVVVIRSGRYVYQGRVDELISGACRDAESNGAACFEEQIITLLG